MKKTLAMLLALCMLTCCYAASASAQSYTAGTYTGVGQGNNGEIKVEAVFSDTQIESVTVVEHGETAGICDPALERIPAEIVEAQSTDVETVSGATMTSKGIIAAVEDAIAQAAGESQEEAVPTHDDMEADIVVVGAGFAGLSASLSAAESGAKVILVEKQAVVGGSGLLTGAGIYAAETDVVPASVETLDEMYDHILEMINDGGSSENVDTERIRHLVDESPKLIEWLESLGMEFSATDVGILNAKPHYHGLADGSMGAGQVKIMSDACEAAGVQILLETKCVALNQQDGAMTGITVEQDGASFQINAKAVVIACGGYGQNQEMMMRLMPQSLFSVTCTNAGATGEVLDMAHQLGAAWYPRQFMLTCGLTSDFASGLGGVAAPGCIVDQNGKRLVNEHVMWQLNSEVIADAANAPFYAIYDSASMASAVPVFEAAVEAGSPYIEKADTLEELAKKCGIQDTDTFVNTVNTYSSVKGTDEPDPEFGTPNDRIIFVTDPPFYAVLMFPLNAGTMGGIQTQTTGEVLDYNGDVITGLYACGEASNGAIYDRGYISGTSILNAYVAGRDAGHSAAAFVK